VRKSPDRGAATKPAHGFAPIAGRTRLALGICFGLSGFAALAFQIAWVRLFGLMFGSSVYSFAAVLGVYLFGLGLGSALVEPLMRRGVTVAHFARLQLGLALVTAAELQLFPRLPEWMYALGERSGAQWSSLLMGELGLAALVLLVPCMILGALFPIATRLLQRADGGHAAGFAYAVNTAGTIAGSLAAGFLLVPRLGPQGTHVVAVVLCVALGVTALLLARARREPVRLADPFALTALAGAALCLGVAPRWDPSLMSAGAFRPSQANQIKTAAEYLGGAGPTVWRATRAEHVLFYREGVNGSVLVGSNPEDGVRWLRVGGKVDASTGEDMATQVLLGLVPAALADSGAHALVIGLGSGTTAAGVLAAGAGRTDVVEIESAVVEASRFFHPAGRHPLDDPRAHLVVGDARTYLAHARQRYGLIVSEPSNPWIAGVNNLFTVDFYRLARSRLAPGGVFCQWMQLYEVSPETFASMVGSFLDVFPEGQVFAVWRAVDVLLVAVTPERPLSLARLGSPEARRLLASANIPSPEAIAGYYAGPFSLLRPVTLHAPLNRDDRPIVEYRAPRDLIAVGRAMQTAHPAVRALVPFVTDVTPGPMFADWSREVWVEQRVERLISQREETHAQAFAAAMRASGRGDEATGIERRIEAGARRARGLDEVALASNLIASGRKDEGRQALERAVRLDPDNANTWAMLADRRRLAGELSAAESCLTRVGAGADSVTRAVGASTAAMIAIAREKPLLAAQLFAEARRWNGHLAKYYLYEAQMRAQGGDTATARAVLRQALSVFPGETNLKAQLDSYGAGR
jgi:spermidine synthase/Flp pilus assembly protein TadD